MCVRAIARREEARARDQAEKAEFEDRLRARDEAKTKKTADKGPKLTREEARREEMKRRWAAWGGGDREGGQGRGVRGGGGAQGRPRGCRAVSKRLGPLE